MCTKKQCSLMMVDDVLENTLENMQCFRLATYYKLLKKLFYLIMSAFVMCYINICYVEVLEFDSTC